MVKKMVWSMIFLGCLVFALLASGAILAEDDYQSPACPGAWILEYQGQWQVRQGEKTMPISSLTPVVGCQGKKLHLDRDMSGLKVLLSKCRVEERDGVKVYVVDEVKLICE